MKFLTDRPGRAQSITLRMAIDTPGPRHPTLTHPNDETISAASLLKLNKFYHILHYQQVEWNKGGSGMSMVYYGVPIFALTNSEEITKIRACALKYNTDNKNSNNSNKSNTFPSKAQIFHFISLTSCSGFICAEAVFVFSVC